MPIYNAYRERTRLPGIVDDKALSGVNPGSFAGLIVWLAARMETAFADNDDVGTWTDHSGLGHDATQATADNKPHYKTGIINGNAVLRFDGTNDTMTLGDLSAHFATAATVFVVASACSQYNLYTTHSNGDADIYWNTSGTGYFGPFRTGRYEGWPAVVPTTGNHLWVVKSVTGVGGYEVIIDNISKGVQNATHAAGTAHGLSENKRLTGDIAEVILYDTVLSAGNIDIIEAYLNAIYAIY